MWERAYRVIGLASKDKNVSRGTSLVGVLVRLRLSGVILGDVWEHFCCGGLWGSRNLACGVVVSKVSTWT